MTLYELVAEAYDNATFNGYNLELMTDRELAEDMHDNDADIGMHPVEEILKCVEQLRNNK